MASCRIDIPMTTQWSGQQEQIFNEFANGTSNFVVEARAGTGKTTTIKEGISRAPETKKCYLAFNKKNVVEAKAKITDPRVQVMSLNSLGYKFVLGAWGSVKTDDNVEWDRINAAGSKFKNFSRSVGSVVHKVVAFAKNTKPFAKLTDLVEMAGSRGFEPSDEDEAAGWSLLSICEVAATVLEMSKVKSAIISFNDQLWLPVALGFAKPWFDLVCIDEAQDMNATQLLLAQAACKKGGRVVLVGDPRQAIYGFRGADVRGMERLKTELKAKAFSLTITYRCPKAVVAIAAQLVPDYQAADSAPEGVVKMSNKTATLNEVKPNDAIISRKNAPLMGLCLALLRKGTPARIEGRDIGRMLLSITQSFKAKTVETFLEAVVTWGDLKMKRAMTHKNAEQLIETIADQVETLQAVAEDAKSVFEIETRLNNLFSDTDSNPRPAVVLSSTHKAKGLEYDRVFLLESTFSPHWTSDINEESNIKYVAITRAKKELTWVRE